MPILTSHESVICQVRANPNDKIAVDSFFESYEMLSDHSEKELITYLQLQYIHCQERWLPLNALGDIYIKKGRKRFAYMCLAESLRLNPQQDHVFETIERLKKETFPQPPLELKENRCKVTIIMRTYNRDEELRESIASVLNQTFQDFELLVINNGGSDQIKYIIDSFKSPKIKYFRINAPHGLANALNEGVVQARGEYIAYLDDDDIIYPTHLENLVKVLDNGKYKFAYSNTKVIEGELEEGKFKANVIKEIFSKKFDKNSLLIRNYISIMSMMHSKSIFSEVGLFEQDLDYAEDWELWLRCALRYAFFNMDKITAEYRYGKTNSSARDLAGMNFFCYIIGRYYEFYEGRIAFLNYYIRKNKIDEARQIYMDVTRRFKQHYQTLFNLANLLPIASLFNDKKFGRQLARAYFKLDANKCVDVIIKYKSANLLIGILPYLPVRVLQCIKNRIVNYLLARTDRGQ
jgi:glycosyltransferase involved in cell wall biosynthesis